MDLNSSTTLADDLLRGVKAIAEFIGKDERATYYLCEQGAIPAGKERGKRDKDGKGGVWIASKAALKAHYAKITGAAA